MDASTLPDNADSKDLSISEHTSASNATDSANDTAAASKAASAAAEPERFFYGEAKVVKTAFAVDEPQQLLMRSIALALDHVGFDAATPEAMEGLRAEVDACMLCSFYCHSTNIRICYPEFAMYGVEKLYGGCIVDGAYVMMDGA